MSKKRILLTLVVAGSAMAAAVCYAVDDSLVAGLDSTLSRLALPEPTGWMSSLAVALVVAFIARRHVG